MEVQEVRLDGNGILLIGDYMSYYGNGESCIMLSYMDCILRLTGILNRDD